MILAMQTLRKTVQRDRRDGYRWNRVPREVQRL
jgi:hypothetical protein